MVARWVLCHVTISVVDMSRSSPATGISSRSSSLASLFCPSKSSWFSVGSLKLCGFGLELKRTDLLKRRLKFVVSAELSKPFSLSLGLDPQVYYFPCHSFSCLLLCCWFFFMCSISSSSWIFDELTE